MKLSAKDKGILRLLNADARTPCASIARKLQMSKQAVQYRIDRMRREGLIKQFYTEFNSSLLGYDTYYVFIHLCNATTQDMASAIKRLSKSEGVGWAVQTIGKWDIVLLLYARSVSGFETAFTDIKHGCGDLLAGASFSILHSSKKRNYHFLENRIESTQNEKAEPRDIDKKDFAIMRAISGDARKSVLSIARETGLSSDVVLYRMKRLKKEGIILGYRLKLDVVAIGMQWSLLLLRMQNISRKRKSQLMGYLAAQDEVYYVTSTIGEYDVMIDLHIPRNEDVRSFLDRLRDAYSDAISSVDALLVAEERKLTYLPL